MDLSRVAFLMLVTPVAIILFFIGHRMDDARNKSTTYVYPASVELTGIIIGILLGTFIAIVWVYILTVEQGIIWANPVLYAPFPLITTLIAYLCYKAAQSLYALKDTKAPRGHILLPVIVLVITLPPVFYSGYTLYNLHQQVASEKSITLSNLVQVPKGSSYTFTGDITVPEDNLYHITATVGANPHATTALALRINGVANIDGLYNFELTKGVNKIAFTPNPVDCPTIKGSTRLTTLTFYVSKTVGDRFALTPHAVKETIKCGV